MAFRFSTNNILQSKP